MATKHNCGSLRQILKETAAKKQQIAKMIKLEDDPLEDERT